MGFLLAGIACSQDPPLAPTPDPIHPGSIQPNPPEDKRVFGVLPNYRTAEDGGIYAPLTSRQKLTIATKDTVDYPLFLLGGGLAGLAQLTGEHPEFGGGVEGYGRRWAASYADQFTGNYFTEGILPVLFREDPRYFRRGSERGGVFSRSAYAASRIFVTRTDHNRNTFNFSEIMGNAISAGIANAYYPGERSLADNGERLGTQLATDALSQILKEFWPDIKRKYLSHHPRDLP